MDKDKYIGRLLDGRYEILEVLGTGGMAVVYKARCHRLNRLVAVKILKDDYTQDEEFRRRFHAESQAVAMLSHPNIVSVYDVSTSGGADFIVMELIDGITLKQYMEKKGVLNWKETLHFAIQIGKALEHAHSRGIVHRDIKPHNVMVLKNGSVKVTDFGIARVMSESNTLTKEALGSVHYISPEQAKGGRVDSRSDIYSLGVVMYEMMTGRPPYDGEAPVSVAIQHINGKAPMPSALNPNIPGGLEQIIMKAMAREPGKRYETAAAMLFDMDEFRKDPTILFDYNNTSVSMDDAARIASNPRPREEKPAVPTTAETVAGKTEQSVRKPQPARKSPAPAKNRRRREEIIEDNDKSSKVATIAIVACSVVLVLAIVIILFIGLGSNSADSNLVTVPNLIGKHLDDTLNITDVTIKTIYGGYSDVYEKNEIIDQKPDANTKIAKNGTVTITVSLGPEPSVKTMDDLTELELDQAKNFLTQVQGIKPELIMVLSEPSSTIKAGRITRTDPVMGGELVEGTVIKLWISSGPEVKMAKMPNLIGHNIETAKNLLLQTGFTVISVEEVESNKTINTVIWQSIVAEKEVSVTTPVVLRIPKVTATQPPAVEPGGWSEPETYVSKRVTINLPEDKTEDYLLSIRRDGVAIEERNIPAGALALEIELSGEGRMSFEVWINNLYGWSFVVDFNEIDE